MTIPSFRVMYPFWYPLAFIHMRDALPLMEQVRDSHRSHKDIFGGGTQFMALTRKCYSWHDWWIKFVSNPDFLLEMFWSLRPNANEFNFSPDVLEYVPLCYETRQGKVASSSDKPFLYPRFDIGYGVEGYGRDNGGQGIHIDYPQRLFSLVWYFTNQIEIEGGELDLHQQTVPGEFKLFERIPIQENKAVLILQNQNGWHSVNPVISCTKPRIALYFSLSCSKPFWKTRSK